MLNGVLLVVLKIQGGNSIAEAFYSLAFTPLVYQMPP